MRYESSTIGIYRFFFTGADFFAAGLEADFTGVGFAAARGVAFLGGTLGGGAV